MKKTLVLKSNKCRPEMKPSLDSLPYLNLWVPSGCNQRCEYCATKGWIPDENPLSLEEFLDIVDQASELNVKQININGSGEVFAWERIKELVDYIHKKGIACRISTNGTLITYENAQWLYKNDVSLVIKLHSWDNPELHNKLVVKDDSYNLIRQGLEKLSRAGFPVFSDKKPEEDDKHIYTNIGIMTLLAKPCKGEIEGILKICKKENLYPMIDDIVVAGNMTKELYQKWALNKIERSKVNKQFTEIMGYTLTAETLDICAIDVGGVFIGRNGNYYADKQGSCCDALAEEDFGNIRTKKLKEVWHELFGLREKNKVYLNKDFLKYKCGSCCFACYGMYKSQVNAGVRK